MGFDDKLLELDKAIWDKVGAFTQYAHKEYGLSKYDLAKVTSLASYISGFGVGFYETLAGLSSADTSNVFSSCISGIGTIVISSFLYHHGKRYIDDIEKSEKSEISLLKKGIIEPPYFDSFRPVGFLSGPPVSGFGVYLLNYSSSPEIKNVSLNLGLAFLCLGITSSAMFLSTYFSTQPPNPPTTKRSILKTIAEKVARPFNPTSEPVKVPTTHSSIDDVFITH